MHLPRMATSSVLRVALAACRVQRLDRPSAPGPMPHRTQLRAQGLPKRCSIGAVLQMDHSTREFFMHGSLSAEGTSA